MILRKFKHTVVEPGFLLTLLLSVSCLLFFFGKLLVSPNETYFGAGGDGLQSYFGALYHVKYDASYWKMNGMNYPYGEQVFFTACQPFVTNILKFINPFVNVYDYTIGILNLIMLWSIVLSALCIYLLFKHLRIPFYYSAIAATAIAYLSPQLDRLGGHYTLTYQFAIPLFLLLLFRFYEQPVLKKSIWIGLFVFFITGTHFYFFGLFAITSTVYWSFLFFSKQNDFGKLKFVLKHFFIQLVLPFLVIQLIVLLVDDVNDRTSFPFGYLEYISNLTGIFFPPARFYSPLLKQFFDPEYPEWEGAAYVGIVGVITFIGILILPIIRLVSKRYRQLFVITENKVLNAFFWGSIPALILAFGYPFKIKGLEWLLLYSGLLKQLRGIGRFTWIFFYVINILAFYKISNLNIKKIPALKHVIMIIALFFICYDAYVMAEGREDNLNNRIPFLEDKNNQLVEYQWLKEINVADFQGLIPLPYTHVGSENIWIFSESEIVKDAFITSLKTGLPLLSVSSSRTSLSQTYKNVQVIKEPYRELQLIKDFKSKKPFLVIARENDLDKTGKDFLTHCQLLKKAPNFNIYTLFYDSLTHITDHLYDKVENNFHNNKTYPVDNFLYTDSVKTFVYDGFEKSGNRKAFQGKGCFEGKLRDFNVIYNGGIPNWRKEEYILSFWIDDFTTDLYPRSTIELIFSDSTNTIYKVDYFKPGESFAVLDHQWGLIEKNIQFRDKRDNLKITIWSDLVKNDKLLRVDELLIIPSSATIYRKSGKNRLWVDNRTYINK